jgi:hypothetical protein
MVRGLMILMRANPLQGPLEGVGPEIETFLSLETATGEAQKSRDYRARPFQWPK